MLNLQRRLQGLVFLALTFLLLWYFMEIIEDLSDTHRFKYLSWPFGIVFGSTAATIIVKLLNRDPSDAKSPQTIGRGITGLVILNLATAVLATVTAQTINPAYDFRTPLLRFSALLLHQFWT